MKSDVEKETYYDNMKKIQLGQGDGVNDILTIKKIKQKSKCDTVVDEVVSMIVKGIYQKGDKLPPENVLCDKFGVSRVTIRESFKKLSMMGAVTIRQGEGTFINHTDIGILLKPLYTTLIFSAIAIEELYDARLYVECGTVALAAKYRSTEDVFQFRDLLFRMRKPIENSDLDAYAVLDSEFHDCIGRASKNTVLLLTFQTIKGILDEYIMKTNRSMDIMIGSYKAHEQIVDAIEEGNDYLAIEIMKAHIKRARTNLLEYESAWNDRNEA